MQFGPDEERDICEERMPERPANAPTEPSGEPWQDDDALASRLLRLGGGGDKSTSQPGVPNPRRDGALQPG
ncbi:MAG: hypothetical protein SangKO_049110 [Sandaracinaceae bacterium]